MTKRPHPPWTKPSTVQAINPTSSIDDIFASSSSPSKPKPTQRPSPSPSLHPNSTATSESKPSIPDSIRERRHIPLTSSKKKRQSKMKEPLTAQTFSSDTQASLGDPLPDPSPIPILPVSSPLPPPIGATVTTTSTARWKPKSNPNSKPSKEVGKRDRKDVEEDEMFRDSRGTGHRSFPIPIGE